MKIVNYYLLFICLVLFSCATNTTSGIEGSNQINSKTSTLSEDDTKECMQYSSWQSDYWKEKNYRRCIYCNIYIGKMSTKCMKHYIFPLINFIIAAIFTSFTII